MTQDQIIQMLHNIVAENQNYTTWTVSTPHLVELVNRAVKAEREACAKVCDLTMLQNQEAINELDDDEHIAKCFIQGAMTQLVKTAKAIRARGEA
jgi:hypothetical protein